MSLRTRDWIAPASLIAATLLALLVGLKLSAKPAPTNDKPWDGRHYRTITITNHFPPLPGQTNATVSVRSLTVAAPIAQVIQGPPQVSTLEFVWVKPEINGVLQTNWQAFLDFKADLAATSWQRIATVPYTNSLTVKLPQQPGFWRSGYTM